MNNDEVLKSIGRNVYCPYLISQNVLPAIVDTLLENKDIAGMFAKSIVPYNRTDFSSRELPAMSVYTTDTEVTSRSSLEKGNIVINIYLPTNEARKQAMQLFTMIPRFVFNVLQTPESFYSIVDKLIPLPDVQASNYNDIVAYKANKLSPLLEIFRNCKIELPKEANDIWKATITSQYIIDMENWMWFLENIGIDYTNPNTIIYPIIEEWTLYTNTLNSNI